MPNGRLDFIVHLAMQMQLNLITLDQLFHVTLKDDLFQGLSF